MYLTERGCGNRVSDERRHQYRHPSRPSEKCRPSRSTGSAVTNDLTGRVPNDVSPFRLLSPDGPTRSAQSASSARDRKPARRRNRNDMTIDNFFQLYQSKVADNPLKHEYLKAVMIAAIEDGHWRDGDKLPTEQVLAEITPFSLGTVQKAVGSLVSEGYVQRKRGLGTFIIPREKRLGEPWIFQILSTDGDRFIPMTSSVSRRVEVESDAAWARWLCGDTEDRRIVRLDRIIAAEDYTFLSFFYIDASRFPHFNDAPFDTLRSENFVKLIKEIYQVSPSRIMHTVRTAPLPRYVADALKLPQKTYGTHLEIMGSSAAGEPVFYQQLYLPAGGPRIYL
jgi:GntR family transcriptional regulator